MEEKALAKALIVGINYVGKSNELNGCINDAHLAHNYISSYVKEGNIRLMTDLTDKQPITKNIKKGIKWLVRDSDNYQLFFHFSGHCSKTKDYTGEEEDGKDEQLETLDGEIRDDELQDLIFGKMSKTAKLTMVFDCCYSGTLMDLEHLNIDKYLFDEGITRCFTKIFWIGKKKSPKKLSLVCISSSLEDEKSYEESKRGILSYYLYKTLDKNPNMTYQQLIDYLNRKIKRQTPNISYSQSHLSDEIVSNTF
jgi:hypothetical protein